MHTRWRHPDISSSAVGSVPPTVVNRYLDRFGVEINHSSHHVQQQHPQHPQQHHQMSAEKRVVQCIVQSCPFTATSNHAMKMHVTMNHPGVDKDELDSKIRQCPVTGCERGGMSMHGLKLHCVRVRMVIIL